VEIAVGVSFTLLPGEFVVGAGSNCNGSASPISLQRELDEAIGGGAGDWIRDMAKPIARLLGKEGCSKCEARRITTNAYTQLKARHGQFEALRIIKELWQLSSIDADQVLARLKYHLEIPDANRLV
jgi:hypothetical protein